MSYPEIITEGVRDLIVQLDQQLSCDYVVYDINYKGSEYKFRLPLFKYEEEPFKRSKKLFIRALLKDAIDRLIDHELYAESVDENPWTDVHELLSSHIERIEMQSPIASEVYAAAHDRSVGKQIDLNYDSWSVKVQDIKLYDNEEL